MAHGFTFALPVTVQVKERRKVFTHSNRDFAFLFAPCLTRRASQHAALFYWYRRFLKTRHHPSACVTDISGVKMSARGQYICFVHAELLPGSFSPVQLCRITIPLLTAYLSTLCPLQAPMPVIPPLSCSLASNPMTCTRLNASSASWTTQSACRRLFFDTRELTL